MLHILRPLSFNRLIFRVRLLAVRALQNYFCVQQRYDLGSVTRDIIGAAFDSLIDFLNQPRVTLLKVTVTVTYGGKSRVNFADRLSSTSNYPK